MLFPAWVYPTVSQLSGKPEVAPEWIHIQLSCSTHTGSKPITILNCDSLTTLLDTVRDTASYIHFKYEHFVNKPNPAYVNIRVDWPLLNKKTKVSKMYIIMVTLYNEVH